MYLSFYGLKIKPFRDSTNPSFFWFGETHKEALAIFKYGIQKMPGILVLTGDVGTGKTTLVNVLINNLGDTFIVVKVPDPGLEEIEFMNYLSDKLNFNEKFASKDGFYNNFTKFLGDSSLDGKNVLLVIDECQRLSSSLLKVVSKIVNIEKDTKKSLKVLLVGQDAFNDVLLQNSHSPLKELVSINYAIRPLNLSETGEFVKHRLKIAGAKREIFSPDAINKIYQFSAGIPRRINIICDHVLLIGFAKEMKTVNADLVRSCVEDLRPQGLSEESSSSHSSSFANEDVRYLRMIPPQSRQRISVHRAGKIFGIIILVLIPVFLTIFLADKMTLRDFVYFFQTGGIQGSHTENAGDTPNLSGPLEPELEQSSVQQTDTQGKGQLPENSMSGKDSADSSVEEDLPDENNPSFSEVVKDGKTDVKIRTVIKSSWRDGFPDITPIGRDIDDENLTNFLIVAPVTQNQQEAAKENDLILEQLLSDTAEVLQSTTENTRTEEVKNEIEITLESVDTPAATVPAEMEMNSVNDVPDVGVAEQSNPGDKEFLAKQNEVQVNARILEDTEENARIDFPDRQIQSDNSKETKDVRENSQENIDPGAIIDWVIKNRSE